MSIMKKLADWPVPVTHNEVLFIGRVNGQDIQGWTIEEKKEILRDAMQHSRSRVIVVWPDDSKTTARIASNKNDLERLYEALS